ncbi:unnamed protein product [Acanthosepion pharaonis]|uniref:Uncharacterized protein n=1 Tax=Acanthosepion pharaonis TaxID=158019 RepID=A0A812C8L8_ACAPH|nr:unnamed protein product [Sepia pharaonis]
MRETSSKLERKWRLSLKERDNLLKKVKIWRQTLRHLLTDAIADEDVVCGLRLVGVELSARHRQSFAQPEKVRWFVTFPKWCHDSLESLKKEMIEWTVETSEHFQMESECRLQVSNPKDINSIDVSDEDNRVFVGDAYGRSIHEFDDSGKLFLYFSFFSFFSFIFFYLFPIFFFLFFVFSFSPFFSISFSFFLLSLFLFFFLFFSFLYSFCFSISFSYFLFLFLYFLISNFLFLFFIHYLFSLLTFSYFLCFSFTHQKKKYFFVFSFLRGCRAGP